MDQWSHYLSTSIAETAAVAILEESEKENQASIALSKWSQRHHRKSSRLLTVSVSNTNRNMGGRLDESHDLTVDSSSTIPVPRRNLAEAFDELYVQPPSELQVGSAQTPATKMESKHLDDISPVCVSEIANADSFHQPHADNDGCSIPHFHLHSDLKGELDQELVNRVSLYGVIFDINKEATTMAANDFLAIQRVASMDEEDEIHSPLVVAVNGGTSKPSLSHTDTALIDEEEWLLTAIQARKRVTTDTTCPPTFLQAMGEREYENPLALEQSRTQLWKPSRSWWEAKSGKNPWIEPKSHNKRWRYLWPLIHYHKFLAKCIKKLKRNGVDVKVSVSPVAVFLRAEVCAVSDHLASVSLFTSEQWMASLEHFHGWTDPNTEETLRSLVSRMKLRPLDEPGDVDSPLLRNQIDAQFLRAMVACREGMNGVTEKSVGHEKSELTDDTTFSSRHGLPLHPRSRLSAPPKPRTISTPKSRTGPVSSRSPNNKSASESSSSWPSHPYMYHHNGQWYRNGWAPQFAHCDESASVHSALSGDSYPLSYAHYDPNFYGMYHPQMSYYPPQTPEQASGALPPVHPGFYPNYDCFNHEHVLAANQSWYGHDPNMMYGASPQAEMFPPSTPGPSSPDRTANDATNQTGLSPYGDVAQTPYKDFSHAPVPMSPFWSHMDYQMRTTLAMTGIVTPHKATPEKRNSMQESEENTEEQSSTNENIDAKPLFVNPQYYAYGYSGAAEGYVPPSPATQFMMSPQANSQAAAYYAATGFNPYYHESPRRIARRRGKRGSPPGSDKKDESAKPTPPPSVIRKTVDAETSDSEQTAATAAESESISG